jgi:N-methylhydantoinase A
MNERWKVGLDIGGTFTDIVALNVVTLEIREGKVPSQPENPVATITSALQAIAMKADDVADLIHATTRVTNAVVQGQFPDVALVATEGFTDTLEIGRFSRRSLYHLNVPPKLPCLVPADLRFGVFERMNKEGKIELSLSKESLDIVVAKVLAAGVSSVAVSLLHSYANPVHEQAIGEKLEKTLPHVMLSYKVNPEAREYERTSVTVLNASVAPLVGDYLKRIDSEASLGEKLQIFHSAGGMASPEAVCERPLSMALSGPAAGVSAAARTARMLRCDRVLSFDMGGTTTDVCLVLNAQAEISDNRELAGRELRQPMVAVHSIGAGGGSIVRVGPGGITVGPESAGAFPGPACYGLGGLKPTITDVNVVLGYLNLSRRLGGEIQLDRRKAIRALEPLANRLNMDVIDFALGVWRVANATMTRALRRVTVDRGIDGRRCTLLAFGGAAPMHAAGISDIYGIKKVLVPLSSSGFSALGCVLADISYSQQRTVRLKSSEWETKRFEGIRSELIEQVTAPLQARNISEDSFLIDHVGLIRYVGQGSVVEVPFTLPLDLNRLGQNFQVKHNEIYGFATKEDWEMQSLRVRAWVKTTVDLPETIIRHQKEPILVDFCCFEKSGKVETPRYDRNGLAHDSRIEGPAIVEDQWSTVVIPPGWVLHIEKYGNLLMKKIDK